MYGVILFHLTWLCSLLPWDWKVQIIKVIEISYHFTTYENNVRFQYAPWKIVWICFTSFVSFVLFHSEWRLYYDRIDLRKRIDFAKTNNSKECIIFRYWFFNHRFKFQDSVLNGCHYLTMLCLNVSDTAIITVKGVNYRCIVHDISKSEAIHRLENPVLDDREFM